MTDGPVRFYGRTKPGPDQQRLLDSGWFDTHRGSAVYASGSWWRNGALVVDEQGPALIDADGERHQLALPPWGGKLVYATEMMTVQGGVGRYVYLFIADEQNHPLIRLPHDGFDKELAAGFAAAAGLTYVEPDSAQPQDLKRIYPGYKDRPHPYFDLRRSRSDREHSVSGRVRRLFGRSESDGV